MTTRKQKSKLITVTSSCTRVFVVTGVAVRQAGRATNAAWRCYRNLTRDINGACASRQALGLCGEGDRGGGVFAVSWFVASTFGHFA